MPNIVEMKLDQRKFTIMSMWIAGETELDYVPVKKGEIIRFKEWRSDPFLNDVGHYTGKTFDMYVNAVTVHSKHLYGYVVIHERMTVNITRGNPSETHSLITPIH